MKLTRITRLQLSIVLALIIVLAGGILGIGYIVQSSFSPPKTASGFVKRSGSQLMLDGHPFRFAGSNMHWLTLDDSANYVSQFRINDGLDAAKEMGATVIRSHSLGISVGCGNCIEPSPGVFNTTAFAHNDYVIKAARDHGLRLIIPLTDNYRYATGGKHTFTDWRGISNESEFYFNAQVIKDFETYIDALLNHVNTYTGVAYKDDPTIMAWETGNELIPPTIWTKLIATYIKNNDHNHLVVDGKMGIDLNAASLTNVDIVSNHYYPMNTSKLTNDANTAKRVGKAFYIGEFNWNDANGGDSLSRFLSTIESNPLIAGDMFWELWSHGDQYGYVSNQIQYTLHYPGDSDAMRAHVHQLRTHAYQIRHAAVPADSTPKSPLVDAVVRDGQHDMLLWRGATLAASYTVERSVSGSSGPWTVICDKCATDTSTPWSDTTPPEGALWYRVIAYNLSGVASNPSNSYQAGSSGTLVDTLNDWSKTYDHSSNLTFDTTNSQHTKGDTSVVIRTTATHEYVTWRQNGMTSFQAISYFWPQEAIIPFSIYTSSDGSNWTLYKPTVSKLDGDWLEYIYTLNGLSNVNYVKMVWENTSGHSWNPNLSQVTITY